MYSVELYNSTQRIKFPLKRHISFQELPFISTLFFPDFSSPFLLVLVLVLVLVLLHVMNFLIYGLPSRPQLLQYRRYEIVSQVRLLPPPTRIYKGCTN